MTTVLGIREAGRHAETQFIAQKSILTKEGIRVYLSFTDSQDQRRNAKINDFFSER